MYEIVSKNSRIELLIWKLENGGFNVLQKNSYCYG